MQDFSKSIPMVLMVGLFIFLYFASLAEGMPKPREKKAKSHKSSGLASSLGKGLTLALAATVALAAGSSRQFPDIQGAVEQVAAAQPPHQNKTPPQPSKMTRRKTVVVTEQNCSYVAPADVQNVPPGETEYGDGYTFYKTNDNDTLYSCESAKKPRKCWPC